MLESEAYPGDVVGVVNPGRIAIGDTLYARHPVQFPPIPQFPAEQFAYVRPGEMRHKRFDEAIEQLGEEGLLQVFYPKIGVRHPIIGVIGGLQFDVIQARLSSEYGIECTIDRMAHVAARWIETPAPDSVQLPMSGVLRVVDRHGRDALIFNSNWELRFTIEKNPDVVFKDTM